MSKPYVFVGSCRAALDVAREIQSQLADAGTVKRWDEEGVFPLGSVTIEVLERILRYCDFGVFVLTADNTPSSGMDHQAASDNVLIEIGMFLGRLSRERTFLVRCKDDDLTKPTDLAGITFATYSTPSDPSGLPGALAEACAKMRNAIERGGKVTDLDRLRGDVERQKSSLRDVRSEVLAIRVALEGVITQFEFDKLEGLDRDGPFWCWYHPNLRAEMRRLYGHGYVRETGFGSGPRIDDYKDSGKQFNLKDHYVLTDKGRGYLRLRRDWQAAQATSPAPPGGAGAPIAAT